MEKEELKYEAKIAKLIRDVNNKSRTCFCASCNNLAIYSHVLQKNGFISSIAEEGHVYKHEYYFPDEKFRFKKVGINQVFTFKGFCSYHDDSLFKEIEKKNVNLNDYKTNLTFAYRVIAQEIVKKKIAIEVCETKIHEGLGDVSNLKSNINAQKLGIEDAIYTQKIIENNLNTPNLKDFNVYFRYVEFLNVCASGVYTFETTKEINEMPLEISKLPLTDIFVNILPYCGKTFVSFVVLKTNSLNCNTYLSNKWKLSDELFVKFLSDVLLSQMENWIISPSFYEKIKKDENIIADITIKALETDNERFDIDYNLFK